MTSVRNGLLEPPEFAKNTLRESSDCSIETKPTVERLIRLWQASVGNDRQAIYVQDSLRGWIPWITSKGSRFLKGDPVLVSANNYDEDADLRNGDLELVVEVFEQPDEDGVVAILEVNNDLINVTAELLEKMHLGYAIVVCYVSKRSGKNDRSNIALYCINPAK